MSLQRMLGMMLASRMAGRGGMRGALGSAGMMRGLGGRGMGRKAGLATLGYMAYRAYQDHQRNQAARGAGGGASGGSAASGRSAASGGGIGGAIGGIVDSLTGGGGGAGSAPQSGRWQDAGPGPDEAGPPPEAELGEDRALLLIRAMVAAANSDGTITPDERSRIVAALDEGGADAEDHRVIERELANPRPLDELLKEVRDPETAQQFYLASRAAVDGSSRTQQSYLEYLRQRLDLPEEDAREVESLAG